MIDFSLFLPDHGTMPFELHGSTHVFRHQMIKVCWEATFSATGRPFVRLKFIHVRPGKRDKEIKMGRWITEDEQEPFTLMQENIFWEGCEPSSEFHDIVQGGLDRYVDTRVIGV